MDEQTTITGFFCHLKMWQFSGKFWSVFFLWFLSRFMDVYSWWTPEMISSSWSICLAGWFDMCLMWVCSDLSKLWCYVEQVLPLQSCPNGLNSIVYWMNFRSSHTRYPIKKSRRTAVIWNTLDWSSTLNLFNTQLKTKTTLYCILYVAMHKLTTDNICVQLVTIL